MRAVLSADDVTILLPSGKKAARKAASVCPTSLVLSRPVTELHIRTVLSTEAVTTSSPSGENRASTTWEEWPLNLRSSRPVAASHTRAVRSYEPVTMRFPSGENAAARNLRRVRSAAESAGLCARPTGEQSYPTKP